MQSAGRWYRARFQWWVVAPFAAVGIGALIAVTFVQPHAPSGSIPIPVRVLTAVAALALLAYGAYTFTAGIRTDENGVTVRQYRLRTHRIPWAQVRGFRPVRTADSRANTYVAVDIRDGGTCMSMGLILARKSKVDEFVAALEADQQHWSPSPWR